LTAAQFLLKLIQKWERGRGGEKERSNTPFNRKKEREEKSL